MKSFYLAFMMMAFVLGGTGCVGAQESSLVGKAAPDFTLERTSGKSASLSEVISGKKAIVFFFATWCPHCRSQMKDIAARRAEFEKQKITLVLVDIGEPAEAVVAFLKGYGINDDAFLDTDSFISETYKVLGVPMLVFIGADGKVRFVEYGLPENYQEIMK